MSVSDVDYSWLPAVVEGYGLNLQGQPVLLARRDEQFVFRLDTVEGQRLTLRLCPPSRSYQRVKAETQVLAYLDRQGFPAPHLRLTQSGEPVLAWRENAWGYLHNFVEGNPLEWSLPAVTEVGQLLGRLHNLAISTEAALPVVKWLDERESTIAQASSYTGDPTWGQRASEVATLLQDLPSLAELPTTLIHSDVHEGNLLYGPSGQLWLLDWELAGKGPALLDVAMVLGWHCFWPAVKGVLTQSEFEFDEQWCKGFLAAYQQVRRLSQPEIQKLGAMIRFVIGWYAVRDIGREVEATGTSEGLVFFHWAILHNLTPAREKLLEQWATETA